jgi:2-methylisocitrate lyase-like PEP mutase family enzyme
MNEIRRLIAGPEPVYAPLVFNPISALLAQAAGFQALYLGGGSMGYIKAGTEANLSLTEMARAALDIRTVCHLPLILDGACGATRCMSGARLRRARRRASRPSRSRTN